MKAQAWIPDLRFAASGMTLVSLKTLVLGPAANGFRKALPRNADAAP